MKSGWNPYGRGEITWQAILACLLMYQDVWGADGINGPFWSIAVEWRIDFLMPPLVWAWRKIGPLATTAVIVALVLAASPLVRRAGLGAITIKYLALFAFGMLAATIATSEVGLAARLRHEVPWGAAAASLGAVMAAYCSWKGIGTMFWRWLRFDFVVGPAWAAMLIYIVTPRGEWLARIFSWRPIVRAGVIGYSLYLIHEPLLVVISKHLVSPLGLDKLSQFAFLVGGGVPMILAASALFAFYFEPRRRVADEAPSRSTPHLAGPTIGLPQPALTD